MNELTHISLFTGIGGFDLAAEWAGFRTIAMCEIDPFCQEVLAARFGAVRDTERGQLAREAAGRPSGGAVPDTIGGDTDAQRGTQATTKGKARFGAVADTDPTGLTNRDEEHRGSQASGRKGKRGPSRCGSRADAPDTPEERLQGVWPEGQQEPEAHAGEGLSVCRGGRPVLIPDIRDFDGTRFRGATLLTGGFPCQPFSHAGKREGRNDKQGRHLWPEMLRVIADARPRWCIAENVPGLISIEDGVVFEQVCTDLEGEGYEVQAFIIPACAVNAPHRRDRVWIVAHREGAGLEGREPAWAGCSRGCDTERPDGGVWNNKAESPDSDAPDAAESGLPHGRGSQMGKPGEEPEPQRCGGNGPPAQQWDIPWIEVASALCDVAYGLPADLDRYRDRWDKKVDRQKEKEFIYEDPDAPWFGKRYKGNNPYTYWRTKSLQAGGNAIVPQVAYQIIKEIAEIEG
jgi:DNA (cytosine-5)-methyltransferase 1